MIKKKNRKLKIVFLISALALTATFVFAASTIDAGFKGEISERPDLDMYPCSDCHEGDVNYKVRELEEDKHDMKLEHTQKDRWCLDCHNPTKRDYLRLSNGDLVTFEQSYRLCAQCHGKIYREWQVGVHGKKIGSWKTEEKSTFIHCTSCHDPHKPQFKALKPKPRPKKPTEIQVRDPEKSSKSDESAKDKKEEKKDEH